MQLSNMVHSQPEPDSHVGHMGHHRMAAWSANDLTGLEQAGQHLLASSQVRRSFPAAYASAAEVDFLCHMDP